MNLSINPELSIASQRIAEDFEAFIARGGQVETLPVGAMAETGWTGRQLLNPQVHTKAMREVEIAEREARKLAKRSIPAPAGSERPVRVKAVKPPKAPKPPKPVKPPKEPKPPRVHVKTGRKVGRPRKAEGTKTAIICQMLADGPLTCREIAIIKGWSPKLTGVTLQKMKERGMVAKAGIVKRPGEFWCMTWKLA